MFQGLLDRASLFGVEGQHLLDEVNAGRRCLLEEFTKVLALSFGEGLHELFSLRIFKLSNELGVEATNGVVNYLQLLSLTFPRQ